MTLQFKRGTSSKEVELCIDHIEDEIRSRYPAVKHIFLEADTVQRASQNEASEAMTFSPAKAIEMPPLAAETNV